MDRNDQQAIDQLFGKLQAVERQAPPRDAEAEAFIRDRIAGQPAAPYYMAQTIVVQEQALNAAQARIEELEAEAARRPSGGGLFGSLFGGGDAGRTRPRPRAGSVPGLGGAPQPPYPGHQPRPGGGFLAGAAQTAMGVAGGVLLGNAIAGMLGGGGEAEAAEPPPEEGGFDDAGFEDEEF